MSRTAVPATVEASPAASRPMLEAVGKKLGVVPKSFRLVSTSPATLEGFLGLSGALAKGGTSAATSDEDRAGRVGDRRLRLLPVGAKRVEVLLAEAGAPAR